MIKSIGKAAYQIAHLTHLSRDEPIHTDIGTVVEINKNGVKRIYSNINSTNTAGYVPIVSIGFGGLRIFENLIELIKNIKNIAMSVFHRQSPLHALKNLSNNIVQIGRGLVEIVPIAGNLIIYTIDRIRIKVIEHQINQKVHTPDHRYYYANGRCVSSDIMNTYENDFSFMSQAGARFIS